MNPSSTPSTQLPWNCYDGLSQNGSHRNGGTASPSQKNGGAASQDRTIGQNVTSASVSGSKLLPSENSVRFSGQTTTFIFNQPGSYIVTIGQATTPHQQEPRVAASASAPHPFLP